MPFKYPMHCSSSQATTFLTGVQRRALLLSSVSLSKKDFLVEIVVFSSSLDNNLNLSIERRGWS